MLPFQNNTIVSHNQTNKKQSLRAKKEKSSMSIVHDSELFHFKKNEN
jgi:hypothetical protein